MPDDKDTVRTNYTLPKAMKAEIVREAKTGSYATEAECVRALFREALDARKEKRRRQRTARSGEGGQP